MTPSTRSRILIAAERLFAANGVDNSSLKMVTEEAGVNLAAVNYHFGSKEDLAFAVFDDLAERISRRRLALLAERKLLRGARPLAVEEIVFFFMEPYVLYEGGKDGALLISMFLHHRLKPSHPVDRIYSNHFDKVAAKFIEAFSESLPHLDKKELYWRYHFMVSSIVFSASRRKHDGRLLRISDGLVDLGDVAELAHQLTIFLGAGMAASSWSRTGVTESTQTTANQLLKPKELAKSANKKAAARTAMPEVQKRETNEPRTARKKFARPQ